jgi:hypothetical protein
VPVRISCVVEGHGDVEAVPIVIKRIAATMMPPPDVQIPSTIRTPKSKLIKAGELERAVELAARKAAGRGAVIVVLDSDDDCPMELGPTLLERARLVRGNIPLSVVLAKREFESWFIAAAESIAGHHGFAPGMQAPPVPEDIRGAKEWLTEHMLEGRTYSPTVDQPILAKLFDVEITGRSGSFDKFRRDIISLIEALNQPENL